MGTWETHDTPPLPEPNIHGVPALVPDHFGDPVAGAVLYAKHCSGCHGLEGKGRSKPKVPAIELTGETMRIVAEGHPNVLMPAFGAAAGGPLSEAQITDLETYMASWELTEQRKKPESEGVNVLVIVMGATAIILVGGAYMSRVVKTE